MAPPVTASPSSVAPEAKPPHPWKRAWSVRRQRELAGAACVQNFTWHPAAKAAYGTVRTLRPQGQFFPGSGQNGRSAERRSRLRRFSLDKVPGYFTVLAGARLPDALDLKPETRPLKS